MYQLIIVRHASASWDPIYKNDFDRPLKKVGISETSLISEYLSRKNFLPDHIISSTAVRTTETAEQIIKNINYKNKFETIDEIYNSTYQNLIKCISKVNNKYKNLMLVGHNPSVTEVINYFCNNAKIDNVPTCGVAIINFEFKWEKIKSDGMLVDFVYPQQLK